MRAFSVLSTVFLLSVNAWAATIIEPTQGTTWNAQSQGQGVAWTSVPTDPTSFSIMLSNTVSLSLSFRFRDNAHPLPALFPHHCFGPFRLYILIPTFC